eukprot:3941488-Rhodomonas_salina.1
MAGRFKNNNATTTQPTVFQFLTDCPTSPENDVPAWSARRARRGRTRTGQGRTRARSVHLPLRTRRSAAQQRPTARVVRCLGPRP